MAHHLMTKADTELEAEITPRNRYPFASMQEGEHVRFNERAEFKKGVSAAAQVTRRKGIKFVSRWLGDYGVIWRVNKDEGIPKRNVYKAVTGLHREPGEISFDEWMTMLIGDRINIIGHETYEQAVFIVNNSAAGENKEYLCEWIDQENRGTIERVK